MFGGGRNNKRVIMYVGGCLLGGGGELTVSLSSGLFVLPVACCLPNLLLRRRFADGRYDVRLRLVCCLLVVACFPRLFPLLFTSLAGFNGTCLYVKRRSKSSSPAKRCMCARTYM